MTADLIDNQAIRLLYFVRIPNVGDLASPALVSRITGHATLRSTPNVPHLLAIGSVLGWGNVHSHVWGSGLLSPSYDLSAAAQAQIHAVRGKLSVDCLRRAGGRVGDVPLGDPGVLVPKLLGIQARQPTAGRIGLVCHHTDRHHPILRKWMRDPDVVDLDVHTEPEAFLRRMALCETVLSTSLHGLIFAEAMGIPNLWIKGYGADVVGAFKFQDWYTTTARPQAVAHQVQDGDQAAMLARQAEIRESTIDHPALASALPTDRLGEICEPTPARFRPLAVCRRHPLPCFLLLDRPTAAPPEMISYLRRFRPLDIIILTSSEPSENTALSHYATYRVEQQESPDRIASINRAITDYFSSWAEPSRYILSDGAIDTSCARCDAIDIFSELLNKHRTIECVGPMIRVQGVVDPSACVRRELIAEIEANWVRRPAIEFARDTEVGTLPSTIGTSFALHRAGEFIRADKKALRTYDPFVARDRRWSGVDVAMADGPEGVRQEAFDCFDVCRREDGSLGVFAQKIFV